MQNLSLRVSNKLMYDLIDLAHAVKRPLKSLAKGMLEDSTQRGVHLILAGIKRPRRNK